jgi:hypothetical protein
MTFNYPIVPFLLRLILILQRHTRTAWQHYILKHWTGKVKHSNSHLFSVRNISFLTYLRDIYPFWPYLQTDHLQDRSQEDLLCLRIIQIFQELEYREDWRFDTRESAPIYSVCFSYEIQAYSKEEFTYWKFPPPLHILVAERTSKEENHETSMPEWRNAEKK